MSAAPRFLEWDTQFFGVPIASLAAPWNAAGARGAPGATAEGTGRERAARGRETGPTDAKRARAAPEAPRGGLDDAALRAALAWCDAERIECLYLRSDADDVTTLRAAGALGFRFVDVRITLDCDLAALPTPAAHPAIRTARAEDVPALREIAAYNHTNTRFYADGRFPRERCDELYATWVEKSVSGWADRVLVPDEGAGASGYLSIHLREDDAAEIGLVGLARDAQGRGLGRQLVESALAWMRARGRTRATVVTQGRNIAAQRLYQAAGFRTSAMELWHHRWFDRG